jgi:hypothetical protein
MAAEDFDAEGKGMEGRDRLGRPPEQARRRLHHRPHLVRRRQGRRDRRRADLVGGAGGQPDHPREGQGVPGLRRGHLGPDRQASARPTPSTGPTTPGRWPTAPARPWWKTGGDTWFFLTADYAFGHALERDTEVPVEEGRRRGARRGAPSVPGPGLLVLPAPGAGLGAKIIGLANAGGDTINSIKQASEFGIVQAGQNLAGLLVFITDVHALGLQTAQGLVLTSSLLLGSERRYPRLVAALRREPQRQHADDDPGRRLFRRHALPQGGRGARQCRRLQGGGGADEGDADRAIQLFGEGEVRADGRKIHEMYLFEVKSPEESKAPGTTTSW